MKYSIFVLDLLTGKETFIETYNTELEPLMFQHLAVLEPRYRGRVVEIIARKPDGTRMFEEE